MAHAKIPIVNEQGKIVECIYLPEEYVPRIQALATAQDMSFEETLEDLLWEGLIKLEAGKIQLRPKGDY